MNNKPVAWMELYYGEPNNLACTNAELKDSGEVYKTIPLYTHPVKELTDEEWLATYMTWCLTSNDPLVLKQAIVRKAQEK